VGHPCVYTDVFCHGISATHLSSVITLHPSQTTPASSRRHSRLGELQPNAHQELSSYDLEILSLQQRLLNKRGAEIALIDSGRGLRPDSALLCQQVLVSVITPVIFSFESPINILERIVFHPLRIARNLPCITVEAWVVAQLGLIIAVSGNFFIRAIDSIESLLADIFCGVGDLLGGFFDGVGPRLIVCHGGG
jgi:hypothetical protein